MACSLKVLKWGGVVVAALLVALFMPTAWRWLEPAPRPPEKRIYPAFSFKALLEKPQVEDWDFRKKWQEGLAEELDEVGAWSPKEELLRKSHERVSREFVTAEIKFQDLDSAISKAFDYFQNRSSPSHERFISGEDNLTRGVAGMLRRIDDEHGRLLLPREDCLRMRELVASRLPKLGTVTDAVGVGITRIVPGESERPSKVKEAKEGKDSTPAETVSRDLTDYQPNHPLKLTISTVLNSPDTLDSVQYVSTFLSIYPYPYPPNGTVILEEELWRRFYAIQMLRPGEVAGQAQVQDLRTALESMKVRILDVKTEVILRDFEHAEVAMSTKEGDRISFELSPDSLPIKPKVGSSLERSADYRTTSKVREQLDLRSTYLSPDANFLRVTQRGIIGVNTAGRFQEEITLHVPRSTIPIPAIALSQGGKGLEMSQLSQPLYSRVDAFVLSIAVYRSIDRLRPTKEDVFGLGPLGNADTIHVVGVRSPKRITLWTWERSLSLVQECDLFGPGPGSAGPVYFMSKDGGDAPAPLVLAGFGPAQATELLSQIRVDLLVPASSDPKGTPTPSEDPTTRRRFNVNARKEAAGNTFHVVLEDCESRLKIRLGRPNPQNPRILLPFPETR